MKTLQIMTMSGGVFSDTMISSVNRYLEEKGKDYRIQVQKIGEAYMDEHMANPSGKWILQKFKEAKDTQAPLDLIEINVTLSTLPSNTQLIDAGYVMPLTDFYNSEDGKRLKAAYPKALWDTCQTRGIDYVFPTCPISQAEIPGYYLVNKELAEKYGIDVSNWSYDYWNHEEELLKVWEGEQTTPNFYLFPLWYTPFQLPFASSIFEGSYLCAPYVYNEETKKVESLFQNKAFREELAFSNKMDKARKAYTRPSSQSGAERVCFIDSYHPADPDKWIVVGRGSMPLHFVMKKGWAIPTWSKNKKEVCDLMTLLGTDPDLNRLIFEDQTSPGTIDMPPWGNPWLYYEDVGAPDLLRYSNVAQTLEEANALYEKWPRSGIYGKTFETAKVQEQINKIADEIGTPLLNKGNFYALDPDELQRRAEACGLNEIIDCLNEQLEPHQNTEEETGR